MEFKIDVKEMGKELTDRTRHLFGSPGYYDALTKSVGVFGELHKKDFKQIIEDQSNGALISMIGAMVGTDGSLVSEIIMDKEWASERCMMLTAAYLYAAKSVDIDTGYVIPEDINAVELLQTLVYIDKRKINDVVANDFKTTSAEVFHHCAAVCLEFIVSGNGDPAFESMANRTLFASGVIRLVNLFLYALKRKKDEGWSMPTS